MSTWREKMEAEFKRKEAEKIGPLKKEQDLIEIKELLLRDSFRFLKEIKGANEFLWRGSLVDVNAAYTVKKSYITRGRLSKAYPVLGHLIFNVISKQKFGWSMRNGVMTSSDFDHVRQFGAQSIFFPKGEYKYLWSPLVKDFNFYNGKITDYMRAEFDEPNSGEVDSLWRWFKKYQSKHDHEIQKAGGLIGYFKSLPNEIKRIANELNLNELLDSYNSNDLKGAIRRGNEVSFNCDEYYLVNQYWKDELREWIANEI